MANYGDRHVARLKKEAEDAELLKKWRDADRWSKPAEESALLQSPLQMPHELGKPQGPDYWKALADTEAPMVFDPMQINGSKPVPKPSGIARVQQAEPAAASQVVEAPKPPVAEPPKPSPLEQDRNLLAQFMGFGPGMEASHQRDRLNDIGSNLGQHMTRAADLISGSDKPTVVKPMESKESVYAEQLRRSKLDDDRALLDKSRSLRDDKMSDAKLSGDEKDRELRRVMDEYNRTRGDKQLGLEERRVRVSEREASRRAAEEGKAKGNEWITPEYKKTGPNDISKEQAGKFQTHAATAKEFKSLLQEYRDLHSTWGTETLPTEAKARMENLYKDLQLKKKTIESLGQISKTDQEMLNDIIPNTAGFGAAFSNNKNIQARLDQVLKNSDLGMKSHADALGLTNMAATPESTTRAAAGPDDSAAVKWARANPNDPRSAKILSMNGG